MRRKGNSLYFAQGEEEKFYRAIRLYGRFWRYRRLTDQEINDTVQHEKAHIDTAIELGRGDQITGYQLGTDISGLFSREYKFVATVCFGYGLSKEESLRIGLAAEKPSPRDFFNATWPHTKKAIQLMKAVMETGGTVRDMKQSILKNFLEEILEQKK